MATHNLNGERPKATGGAKGEVVTSQASVSPLKAFTERLKVRVKEIYNLHIKEQTVMFWINDIFVTLEPQLEEDGSLIYTTIDLAFMNDILRVLGRLCISSNTISFEDEYKTLTCKFEFEEIGADPIYLTDEEELVNFLNELSKINYYEEFEEFAENEFLNYSGLRP